jgi:aspartate kinase
MHSTGVLKFGGAAVAEPAGFHRIGELIAIECTKCQRLVVVISAMGGMTDTLLGLAKQVHPEPPRRESDMLVSVGERISGALLAMALAGQGVEAVSLTGSQAGIITCSSHGEAQIIDLRPYRVEQELERGRVVIVAGFQGVSKQKEVTTLGRGGSDTTAVALAAALHVNHVTFYKDVPGIFSSDPKIDRDAEPFSFLTYDQALEIAESGAKVLHPRAIRLARKKEVGLSIRSFLHPQRKGTYVAQNSAVKSV